jgi:aspartokinase-like uncharacterized kinase
MLLINSYALSCSAPSSAFRSAEPGTFAANSASVADVECNAATDWETSATDRKSAAIESRILRRTDEGERSLETHSDSFAGLVGYEWAISRAATDPI